MIGVFYIRTQHLKSTDQYDAVLLRQIIFLDEAHFTKDGFTSELHYWSEN